MTTQSITTEGMEVHDPVPDLRRADPRTTSFESFVHVTAASMHRTALLLCGEHHLAEDLTQTAYAKVFASWRRVVAADDPVAYTRKILVRTFLSHRRLRRSSERPVDAVPDAPGPAADASSRLDLLAALGSLSADDRAVLVLRYWEDLSVADSARLLGVSDAACRQRTTRALARIRTLLPDLEEDR
ncbi:MAG TPA: SigE family RNA polymerase sigma factor [Marmoricola sp.]|nr:SigE family RNA polymerase sigma factor [Marmoricola sp.]